MLNVYVAGASAELPRAKLAIAKINEMELARVTVDWPGVIEAAGAANGPGVDDPAACARMDLAGVADADVVLLLVPSEGCHSTGLWCEYGYALNRGAFVVASGPAGPSESIFLSLASKRCPDDAAALLAIVMLAEHSYGDAVRP